MSGDLVSVTEETFAEFQGLPITGGDCIDQRWAVANRIADAVGASRRGFHKLINEMTNKGELKEGMHFKFIPLKGAQGAIETTQTVLCLSYRGVIRVVMRSDAPKAIAFRDWAETVLHRVMTIGHYETPAYQRAQLANLADFVDRLGTAQTKLLESQAILTDSLLTLTTRIVQIENTRESINSVNDRSLREFFTPTQWAEEHKPDLPRHFNSSGHFDKHVAIRFHDEFGRWPEQRKHPLIRWNTGAEWILPNTPDMNAWMDKVFQEYMRGRGQQLTLKCVPLRPAERTRASRYARRALSRSTLPRHRRGKA